MKPVRMLRDHTQWRVADALRSVEAGPWDMVLCRNMAIYFNTADATKLWRRVVEVMRPGGFLVTGKAEQGLGPPDLTRERRSVYRKRQDS